MINKIAPFIVLALLHAARAASPTDAIQVWVGAEYLFTGKLTQVQYGPVGLSNPPVYSTRLTLVVDTVMRGPLKKGQEVVLNHSARQQDRPVFPEGQRCLVKSSKARGGFRAEQVVPAEKGVIAAAESAMAIPIGWRFGKNGLVSPWAGINGAGWGQWQHAKEIKCATTRRPAWLAGEGIVLSSEKVPPPKEIKWTNPDGDGEYFIKVKNTSKEKKTVWALIQSKDGIYWKDSLIIMCQDKAYTVPGAQGRVVDARPVTLEPGQEMSTVVNALQLKGPEWPKGGYRIEFQFCLGELSTTQSFYYMSRHHDGVRKAALNKLK